MLTATPSPNFHLTAVIECRRISMGSAGRKTFTHFPSDRGHSSSRTASHLDQISGPVSPSIIHCDGSCVRTECGCTVSRGKQPLCALLLQRSKQPIVGAAFLHGSWKMPRAPGETGLCTSGARWHRTWRRIGLFPGCSAPRTWGIWTDIYMPQRTALIIPNTSSLHQTCVPIFSEVLNK